MHDFSGKSTKINQRYHIFRFFSSSSHFRGFLAFFVGHPMDSGDLDVVGGNIFPLKMGGIIRPTTAVSWKKSHTSIHSDKTLQKVMIRTRIRNMITVILTKQHQNDIANNIKLAASNDNDDYDTNWG